MHRFGRVVAVTLMLAGMLASFPFTFSPTSAIAASPSGRYIVTLKNDQEPRAAAEALAKRYNLDVTHVYDTVLNGFAAKVPEASLQGLAKNPRVRMIDADLPVQAVYTVPKGIDRVGAENVNGSGTHLGAGVTTAVVDTGIASHSELNVVGGYNCTTSDTTAWGDGHGHGTHVAGTIGAKGVNIIGVAPGTPLLGVKVLDNSGSGAWSWIICGIDWVAGSGNGGVPRATVINMSLGGQSGENASTCSSSSLHLSICNAVNKGVRVVVAAGNDGINASGFVPAKYAEAITVAAMVDTDGCEGGFGTSHSYGADDTLASFSNYGSIVDVAAPGVSIYSTYPGGYATMSGTSMASPHVAGMVAAGGYTTVATSFGIPLAVVPGGALSCANASAPNTTITSTVATPTKNTSVTINFSANVSSTFECKLDAGSWSACGGPATTGSKSLTGLADGSHTFSVRATANGLTDASPAAVTWVVDTANPTGSITAPAANAAVSGTVSVTSDAADTNGSGILNVQFQSRPTGGTWANLGAADTASPFAASWNTVGLTNGGYELRAVITDKAANTLTTTVVAVTVANPAETTVTSAPPALTNQTGASIAFTSNDPTATFECSVDGGAYAACTSPMAMTELVEGVHTVSIQAVNLAGADATPATVTWTVDLTAPTATFSFANTTVSGTVAVAVTASDANSIQSVRLEYAPTGTTNWTAIGTDNSAPYSFNWNTTTVTNGVYDVRAVVTDAASNVGESAIATVTVNNIVAAISVNPTSGKGGSNVVITGSGFQAGESVVIYWDAVKGRGMTTVVADANGNFTVTVKVPTKQRLGAHTFIARGQASGKQATVGFQVI